MGAHEDAGGRNLGQYIIQGRPVATIDDRIDPDQYAVDAHELLSQVLDSVSKIGCRLDRDTFFGKRSSSPGKARVFQSGLLSPLRIGRKHDRHLIGRDTPDAAWHGSAPLTSLVVSQSAECGDAIGFGPKAYHAGQREGGILDCKQRLAVEDDVESGAGEFNPQGVPLVGGHSRLYAVTALLADKVERATYTVHGLVEHDVVFERVRAHDVIVVGISCPPDDAARPILRA